MPDPLPFQRRPRPLSRAEQLRAHVLRFCMDVTLTKGDRARRYWIRPGKNDGEWYCQVWHGTISNRLQTQHRGEITTDFHRNQRLTAEYCREIDELVLDGWAVIGARDGRQTEEARSTRDRHLPG